MGVWAEGRAQPCEEPQGGRAVVTAYDANTQLSPSCRCAEEPVAGLVLVPFVGEWLGKTGKMKPK